MHLEMRQGGIEPSLYIRMDYLVDYRDSEGNELTPDMSATVWQCGSWTVRNYGDHLHLVCEVLKGEPRGRSTCEGGAPSTEENDSIRNSKNGNEYESTEEDLEEMTYNWYFEKGLYTVINVRTAITLRLCELIFGVQVVQETLRLASVVFTTVRKSRTDFEYEGQPFEPGGLGGRFRLFKSLPLECTMSVAKARVRKVHTIVNTTCGWSIQTSEMWFDKGIVHRNEAAGLTHLDEGCVGRI